MTDDPFIAGLRRIIAADPNLTQTGLSLRAGLDESTLGKLLRGNAKSPKLENCLRIAGALGMTIEQVIAGGQDGHPVAVQTVPLISPVSAGPLAAGAPIDKAMIENHVDTNALGSGDWIAFRVDGDSMNLVAPHGSIIFVNRRETGLVEGGYYVICDDSTGEATFKRHFANPMRFEPESSEARRHKTIFPDNTPKVIGRVRRILLEL